MKVIPIVAASIIGSGAAASEALEYRKDGGTLAISQQGHQRSFLLNTNVEMHVCEIEGVMTIASAKHASYRDEEPTEPCSIDFAFSRSQVSVSTLNCNSYCGLHAIGSMDGVYRLVAPKNAN